MASTETVLAESNKGYAPAEIDKRLGLRRGEARRTMVGIWKRDNEMAALARVGLRRSGAMAEEEA